ncbi:MAG: undecaprenyl diphosphate synthase family protein [Gemmatimonadota bacterium]
MSPTRRGAHLALVLGDSAGWPRRGGDSEGSLQQRALFNLRRAVWTALELGVHTVTVYALAPSLWEHDGQTVTSVLGDYAAYLRAEADALRRAAVNVSVIGRRDRLTPSLKAALQRVEQRTSGCRRARLRLGIDYSARGAFERARRILELAGVPCTFDEALALAIHDPRPTRPVDLVVAAGGADEADDALFWEAVYAPVVRVPTPWPEWDPDTLRRILHEGAVVSTGNVPGAPTRPRHRVLAGARSDT